MRKTRKSKLILNDTKNLTVIKRLELGKLMRDEIFKGTPKGEIIRIISNKFGITEEADLNMVYSDGLQYYQERIVTRMDLPRVVQSHVEIYEDIYRFFDELDSTQFKLKVMHAKERLLGFHKNDTILSINETNNITDSSIILERYRMTKLTEQEKKRVKELIEKGYK